MADEPKKTAKKPPAHEVILDRIEDAQRALRELVKLQGATRVTGCAIEAGRAVDETVREHRAIALALLEVLNRMHLPEPELPKIRKRLHALDADVIGGTIQPYVQLMKCLSDHSPTHVAGTKPTRRRA